MEQTTKAMQIREIRSLIGGRFVEDGRAYDIHSPFDGHVVTRAVRASNADLERAIVTAAAARPLVAALPRHERADILERFAVLVREARADLAMMLCEEAGKPITLAEQEVDRSLQTIADAAHWTRYPEEEVLDLSGSPFGAGRYGVLRRVPLGVVGAITPFNFPLNLVTHKIAPAIAAGCPVVLKPASQTPSMAVRLAELALEAGLPADALNVVLLSGADADPLVTDDRIALLTFTGSAEVGWNLKVRCGKKRIALELGGNAAAIVEPDADLEYAARRIAAGAFGYAGQSCISVQRVLVQDNALEPLTGYLEAAAKAVVAGDPKDPRTVCGPLIDQANADRVDQWIADAVARGATIVTGGQRKDSVITPTVLANVPDDCDVSCSEVFGPVMTLASYGTLSEALAQANDTRFGLQAGIFTNDIQSVWTAFNTIEVGGVIHNDVPTFRVDQMPYGGVKDSGTGREGARYAIHEMTEPRLLVLKTG